MDSTNEHWSPSMKTFHISLFTESVFICTIGHFCVWSTWFRCRHLKCSMWNKIQKFVPKRCGVYVCSWLRHKSPQQCLSVRRKLSTTTYSFFIYYHGICSLGYRLHNSYRKPTLSNYNEGLESGYYPISFFPANDFNQWRWVRQGQQEVNPRLSKGDAKAVSSPGSETGLSVLLISVALVKLSTLMCITQTSPVSCG